MSMCVCVCVECSAVTQEKAGWFFLLLKQILNVRSVISECWSVCVSVARHCGERTRLRKCFDGHEDDNPNVTFECLVLHLQRNHCFILSQTELCLGTFQCLRYGVLAPSTICICIYIYLTIYIIIYMYLTIFNLIYIYLTYYLINVYLTISLPVSVYKTVLYKHTPNPHLHRIDR